MAYSFIHLSQRKFMKYKAQKTPFLPKKQLINIWLFFAAIDPDQCGFGFVHVVFPNVRDTHSNLSSHTCNQQSPRGWPLRCHGNHHQIVSATWYHISV